MAHTGVRMRERRTIEDMLKTKISVGQVLAIEIGRHRSPIFLRFKPEQNMRMMNCQN